MNTHLTFQYPHPPTSEEAIAAFEKELGFRLPENYRQFLLKYNGGRRPTRPDFDYNYPNGKEQQSAIDSLFGLSLDVSVDLRTNQNTDYKPDYLLIVGSDLGNLLGIGIANETTGRVYVWEHTRQGDVILLANSFNEFLDMLYDDES